MMRQATAVPADKTIRRRRWLAATGLAIVTVAALIACGGSGPEPADTVLRHGSVYTVDASDSVAQAVAVRAGQIVYVGSDSGVTDYVGSKTQVIDLGGRMLMPGLVDGHMHPMSGGAEVQKCSFNYAPLTIAQMRSELQTCLDASKDRGPDAWLEVVSWDRQAMYALDRDPTRADLDALVTTRPIIVTSIDHHTRLVNSRGLAVAGVTAATPDPAGGKIVRDNQGEPTGIFEDAAVLVVDSAVPAPTDEEQVTAAKVALELMGHQGITTFLSALSRESDLKAFTTVQQRGELTARGQFAMLIAPDAAADPVKAVADVKAIAAKYDQGSAKAAPGVEARHVKMFMDGVLQAPAQTAATLAPYNVNVGTDAAPHWVPGTTHGSMYLTPEVLNPLVVEAVKAGFDPHVHAIGDASVRTTLDAIEHARTQLPGNPFRPAIAHDESVDPADYGRFKSLGVIAVMSFQWAQQAPYSIEAVKDQLGPDRYARMEPEGSLYNAGATIAYGSDWPVDPMAHFLALKIGVTRKGDPTHPASFGPAYAGRLNDDPLLPRNVALRSITMNSAYQLRLDKVVGSIEPGKFADLIVLDRNFMTEPEDDLGKTQVLLTMVGGRIVFTEAPFASAGAHGLASSRPSARKLNYAAATGHAVTKSGDGHRH